MPRYSAKQRKMRGGGKSSPPFIKLPQHVKLSVEHDLLSIYARALLIELIDRHTGANNGMICFGVREATYELRCGKATVSRAMRELDDAGLARPTAIGAWRGRQATEWRLMWIRCDKTGDLPRTQWTPRQAYEPTKQPPPRKPLSDAERARRYRHRKGDRHENRHDEFR